MHVQNTTACPWHICLINSLMLSVSSYGSGTNEDVRGGSRVKSMCYLNHHSLVRMTCSQESIDNFIHFHFFFSFVKEISNFYTCVWFYFPIFFQYRESNFSLGWHAVKRFYSLAVSLVPSEPKFVSTK